MEHRLALLTLNMLPGIGPWRKRMLVEYFGSVEGALSATEEALSKVHGIGPRLARQLHGWRNHCDPLEEVRFATQCGVLILTEDDDCYPPLLREISDPPICLYVRGNVQALAHSEMSIALVGSRNATNYGCRMARALAMDACRQGFPVVSGLARGIDTAAHQASLEAGGITIAVTGSGLADIYPRENLPLAATIAERGGAVISEFPMKYQPDKRSFPMRNRIISGITRGCIVVEAGCQSGSLITAGCALEQGRTVFAVPGMVDAPYARGCHSLIRDGAVLTESFQDVINELTLLPGLKEPPPERHASPPPPPSTNLPASLTGLEKLLYEKITAGEEFIDNLIDATGEAPSCVNAALITLELKRLIRRCPGSRVEQT